MRAWNLLISEFAAAARGQWLDIKALLDGAQMISPYEEEEGQVDRRGANRGLRVLEYLETEVQDRKTGIWLGA